MSSVLALVLAATTLFIPAKNGETGILIEVQQYQLVSQASGAQTLVLCRSTYNTLRHLHALGWPIQLSLIEYGTFDVEERQNNHFGINGYTTIISFTNCQPKAAKIGSQGSWSSGYRQDHKR